MEMPTANGVVTVRTTDGRSVGHGWGEVRVRRDSGTGTTGFAGEVREMTWSDDLPPSAPGQTYLVDFYGGVSFLGVFDAGFPDARLRRAPFRPTGQNPGIGRQRSFGTFGFSARAASPRARR